jgi:uncharacterized protein (DUF2267 family)
MSWWLLRNIIHVKVATLLFLGLGTWTLYEFTRSTDSSLGYLRRRALEAVSRKAAAALPQSGKARSLAVLPFEGDPNQHVRKALMHQIDQAKSIFQVAKGDFLERVRMEREKPAESLAEALQMGAKLGVDTVAFGKIPAFTAAGDESEIALELCIADRSTGQPLVLKRFQEKVSGGFEARRARIADSSLIIRILIWCGFTLLLPFVLTPMVRSLLGKDSNMVNFMLLIGLSIASLAVAWLLTGLWIGNTWTLIALVVSLVAAGLWNYRALDLMERLR